MNKDSITGMNPVRIIALFAALSEASAATALPFLHEDNQTLYVWFLIVFPCTLTLMFFLTLNFNYKALYAPSDFSNEKNFLKVSKKTDLYSKDTPQQPPLKAPTNGNKKKSFSKLLLHPANRQDAFYGGPISCQRDLKNTLSLLTVQNSTSHSNNPPSARWILVIKDWDEPMPHDELIELINRWAKSTPHSDISAVWVIESDRVIYL
ncbi:MULTISPECIES: hypothetical protein [unclassified Pseudomonas]|uniref:hypothetical protein n=1 Tax=unclassified Pseudomonas TaxID=196821 RepID=UPI002E8019C5|nr:hypothetical protein [Pseudomonas sp. 10C3]MEE3504806.1 hypothetical protein [Pseudomonas sp. 10C3]